MKVQWRRAMRSVLLTALLLAACGEDGPRLAALADDAVILAFGDSLTYGTGARQQEAYPAILATRIGREVINAGVPGELSAAGRARLEKLLASVSPALLILCHGGNDMLRKKSADAARANIESMINHARELGIDVLLLGVPKPGLWLSTAEIYPAAAAATGVPLEATSLADILGDAGLKSDPVHPNAQGYAVLAERIHTRLIELGALSQ